MSRILYIHNLNNALMKEEWKDIIGYEGVYQISNLGRVKSLPRIIQSSNKGHVYTKRVFPRFLHPNIDAFGYLNVNLYKGKKCLTKKIHRLVAEHFIPNPNGYNVINHKDENKTNNVVTNLEWCTQDYNVHYGTGLLRRAIAFGTPVTAIKEGKTFGFYSIRQAARETGVSREIINNRLSNGKEYKGYKF